MNLDLKEVSPNTLAALEWMLYNDLQNAPSNKHLILTEQLRTVRQEMSDRKLPPREPSVETEFASMLMDHVDEESSPPDPWFPVWLHKPTR